MIEIYKNHKGVNPKKEMNRNESKNTVDQSNQLKKNKTKINI